MSITPDQSSLTAKVTIKIRRNRSIEIVQYISFQTKHGNITSFDILKSDIVDKDIVS